MKDKSALHSGSSSSHNSEDTEEVKVTPLPLLTTITLVAVLLSESLCDSMLIPFVGLFIAHISDMSADDAGYRSGFMVGVFMLGQVLSSKLWGYFSDEYGRKLPMLVSVLSGAVIMFFFGFSSNFYLCCLLRFVQGFLNGSTLISKAIISDITDATNQAKGFALVSITWSVGFIVGSFFGGFFYDPVNNSKTQWMGLKPGGFLDKHPAFLPSAIIASYNFLAVILATFTLPETNMNRRRFSSTKFYKMIFGNKASDVVVESTFEVEERPEQQPPAVTSKKISYKQAMSIAPVRNITIFYVLLAASDMAFTEILPLWAVASKPEGLAIDPADIAILNLCFSIPATVANMFFQNIRGLFHNDDLSLWRWSVVIGCVGIFLVPFATMFDSSTVSYFFVLFWGLVRQVGISWLYSIIHLMTANVSPRGYIGSIYAISQSFASLTRCVVPFFIAPLFAWSINGSNPPPFNHYLVFFLCVIPPVVTSYLTLRLSFARPEEEELLEEVEDAAASSDEERDGVYLSLVASFVTNPLNDWFLDVPAEEKRRQEAHEEQLRREEEEVKEEEERASNASSGRISPP